MTDCVFCAVAGGESPAHRVYEDERTVAFLDVAPATRGHVLVVPTDHRESLTDAEPSLVGELFRTVRDVAAAVESAFEPDGVNVVQSNGAAAGQEVFHAHVHVVPRYEDDDVTITWSPGDGDDGELQAVADALDGELPGNK